MARYEHRGRRRTRVCSCCSIKSGDGERDIIIWGGGSEGCGRCMKLLFACAGACCTGRAGVSISSVAHICSAACTVWYVNGCAALAALSEGNPACTVCAANADAGRGIMSGRPGGSAWPPCGGAGARGAGWPRCMTGPLRSPPAAGEGCAKACAAAALERAWCRRGSEWVPDCGSGGVPERGCGGGPRPRVAEPESMARGSPCGECARSGVVTIAPGADVEAGVCRGGPSMPPLLRDLGPLQHAHRSRQSAHLRI